MDNEERIPPPIPLKTIYQLEKATKEEMLDKYEEVLFQRENQIRDLSYQMGLLNEQLYNSCEKLKQIAHEKEEIEKRIAKKDSHLQQEVNNKEIMLNKLTVLVNENDKLKKVIQTSSTDLSLFSDGHHNKRSHSIERGKTHPIKPVTKQSNGPPSQNK